MSSVFLYPKGISGKCYKSHFRIINKLDIKPSDLKPHEIEISKDNVYGETLVGRPLFELTKYDGKLYEKLIQLNLPHEGNLGSEEKNKIIKFISDYSSPYGPIKLGEYMSDPIGKEINWVFIPYEINFHRTEGDFYRIFRNMYVDFVETVEIIKSGSLELLNSYHGNFNDGLKGNYLYLPKYNNGYRITWFSNTCLDLCYLELYELIISNQKIKNCKYCNQIFESSKSNEVRCNNCKNPAVYRKLYYYRNPEKEREKARERMRKIRKGIKN